MPHEFSHSRRVEFAETDMAGIAHYSNFFRWMEEAEHAFLRSLGVSVVQRSEMETVSWPRVSVGCDYFRPAHFEDLLEIRLNVEKRGAKSLTYLFTFLKDGVELARGRTTAVCCRIRAGHKIESIEIPPAFDAIRQAPSGEDAA